MDRKKSTLNTIYHGDIQHFSSGNTVCLFQSALCKKLFPSIKTNKKKARQRDISKKRLIASVHLKWAKTKSGNHWPTYPFRCVPSSPLPSKLFVSSSNVNKLRPFFRNKNYFEFFSFFCNKKWNIINFCLAVNCLFFSFASSYFKQVIYSILVILLFVVPLFRLLSFFVISLDFTKCCLFCPKIFEYLS